MKKIKTLLFSAIALSMLTSCGTEESKNIFISEAYVGSSPFNSALEITSYEKEISGYKLNVYKGKDVIFSISLDDKFKDETYVIANKSANEEIKKVADEVLNDDYFFGFNYIEVSKGDKVIDSIGNKIYETNYISGGSLIRNELNQKPMASFDQLAWYKVKEGVYKYLGNVEVPITYEDFIKGPKLTPKYTDESVLFSNGKIPLGGITETKVSSLGDGDTTNFVYDATSGLSGVFRTRYYLINTPEIDHGPGSSIVPEPFGQEAKRFTNSRLNKAKHILLQSAFGGQLHETYGRNLAFVWYTEKENPEFSDYVLLNYEVVLNGLATFDTRSKLEEMYDDEILYYSYFEYAVELAKTQKIKIWGETDPEFDYN